MKLLYYNCTFALFIFRLHKVGIEAHAYAHYTSLLCFSVGSQGTGGGRYRDGKYNLWYTPSTWHEFTGKSHTYLISDPSNKPAVCNSCSSPTISSILCWTNSAIFAEMPILRTILQNLSIYLALQRVCIKDL